MSKREINYIYVDGSFNPENFTYGYGVLLVDKLGVRHVLQGRGDDPDFARLRNVAGEILGAMEAISAAFDVYEMSYITLYYDYDGIANWPLGKWKPRNKFTKYYAQFVQRYMERINIDFLHVKSHTGILENEEVDRLAKESVGIWPSLERS